MTDERKRKPEPRRVPSDDCEVTIAGEKYYPHVGESLWVIGSRTLGEMKATWAFNRLSAEMDETKAGPQAEGESDADYEERVRVGNAAGLALVEKHYDDLVAWFASRVKRWDWTDNDGIALPPIDGTANPFAHLSPDELFYVKDVLQGEGTAEVLNAVPPSTPTSSAKP